MAPSRDGMRTQEQGRLHLLFFLGARLSGKHQGSLATGGTRRVQEHRFAKWLCLGITRALAAFYKIHDG
jgi:hypothetical protein